MSPGLANLVTIKKKTEYSLDNRETLLEEITGKDSRERSCPLNKNSGNSKSYRVRMNRV